MPEYLEATVDKFIFRVASDRLYSADGAWAFWLESPGQGRVRIGLTDYVQQRNGDMTFVHARPVGTEVAAGDEVAELETIKANVSLCSPVSGRVVEVNPGLDASPEAVNQEPYGKGWVAVLETTNWEADRAKLLDPPAYLSAMRSQAEEELKR
jgi:glycine cleavage system H protein